MHIKLSIYIYIYIYKYIHIHVHIGQDQRGPHQGRDHRDQQPSRDQPPPNQYQSGYYNQQVNITNKHLRNSHLSVLNSLI
jgi:hypothetical protein